MQNYRGPGQGRPFSGPRRPPDNASPRQNRGDGDRERLRALLSDPRRAEYVSAEKPGSGFLDADAGAQAERLAELAQSQLRRFYGMVTGFKRRLELDSDNRIGNDDVQAQVVYLKAAAAYAAGRRQTQETEELVRFFTAHANSVKTRAHFERFCRHFEAVVAYHKVFGKKE